MDAPLPLRGSRDGSAARLDALFATLVILCCAWFYILSADVPATARDQVADMRLALSMRETGTLSDGNRHPLLPALLAPFAERDPRFTESARFVAVAAAALALLCVYAGTALVFPRGLALLACALGVLELRFHARRIAPEPLAAGFLVLSTGLLASAAGSTRVRLRTFLSGAALGVAWLAKGTVLLSLFAVVLWLPFARGRRRLETGALLLAGFVATAWPLLAWNAAEHGSPFHNANTAHVMWEDAWDAELDLRSTATPATWFATHDLGDAARRLGRGLVRQKGVEWPYGFLALVGAFALLRRAGGARHERPAGADGARHDRPAVRDWRRIAVVSCLVWVPPFAWYEPIVASRRFLFPLVPVLLPPALDLVGRFVRGGRDVVVPAPSRRVTLGLGLVAVAVAIALVLRAGPPDPARHLPPGAIEAARATSSFRAGSARVLAKPSRTAPPDWLVDAPVALSALPGAVPAPEALDWIRARFDAVLMSSGLLHQRPAALAPLARWDDSVGVVLADPLPPGFALRWRDPAKPSRYALLTVSSR